MLEGSEVFCVQCNTGPLTSTVPLTKKRLQANGQMSILETKQ
jgi:hypothetical protein